MSQEVKCQIHCMDSMSEPLASSAVALQRGNRLKRMVKRRLEYLQNWFEEIRERKETKSQTAPAVQSLLQPGETVRVKTQEEIKETLNRWNQLKGCAFMEEMWPYCGTPQKVFKRVEKFLDERDYLVKRCKGIIILEGVLCEGTRDFGVCDRSCYFFWREEWLEKVG